jgi:mannose-6-phosphate isomerase-like protein (cupin superfamily)
MPSKHINQLLNYYLMDDFALSETEGQEINFRGTKMLIKVSEDDSEGRYSLIEMIHPPNKGPALHIHPNAPEAYYVLEGEYLIQCGTRSYHAKIGEFVFIPKGIPHNYKSSSKGGKVLVISPAGLEKYFKEVSDILQVGQLTWELEQEIARRYGQEFLDSVKHWGQ